MTEVNGWWWFRGLLFAWLLNVPVKCEVYLEDRCTCCSSEVDVAVQTCHGLSEREAEEKMASATSSSQQTGCILPPSLRRPSDHDEPEDRPLQIQTSHVHPAPCWYSALLWHIPSDSRTPAAELSDHPELLSRDQELVLWRQTTVK